MRTRVETRKEGRYIKKADRETFGLYLFVVWELRQKITSACREDKTKKKERRKELTDGWAIENEKKERGGEEKGRVCASGGGGCGMKLRLSQGCMG